MQRVRLTLDPGDTPVHPAYDLVSGGAEYLERVEFHNWNVGTRPAGLLAHVEGDLDRLAADLRALDTVRSVQVIDIADREGYCYVSDEGTATSNALYDTFTQGGLLTVPPIVTHPDGTVTYTIVGPPADVQAAVDGVPDAIDVHVEAVGGEDVAEAAVVERLSDRQREAVEAAIAAGYYDVPRTASTADVAEALECSPTTASTHLRKAESTLLRALLG